MREKAFLNKIVFGYHSLFPRNQLHFLDESQVSYNIKFSQFIKQVTILKKHHNKNSFLITFDDGFQTDYIAARFLKDETIFFINVSNIGKHGFLNEAQIKEISDKHYIGSHSLSHCDLTKLTRSEIHKELYRSKVKLETLVNNEVDLLAFPYGKYNCTCLEVAQNVGYKYLFNTEIYNIDINNNKNRINRILINTCACRTVV